MTVLVLHRFPLGPFPYDRWLSDFDGGVVMIAARDAIAAGGEQLPAGLGGYRHLEIIDTFDDGELVDRLARDLAYEYQVTHVIAHHEADLHRAAALREKFGLPGQLPSGLLPFRDKALMKRKLAAAGLEVVPHAQAGTAAEVRAFGAAHGLPLVFKVIDGTGTGSPAAAGPRIAGTGEELEEYLAEAFPAAAGPREDLLVEAYVEGRTCHVDGVVAGGRTVMAWPSRYEYDPVSFGSGDGALVDLTLAPSDPLTPRLLALVEEALGALEGPADHAFHAKVFHTPDDRLVVCEITARPAGGRVRDVLSAVFGVHPVELAARAEVGLRLPAVEARARSGGRLEPVRMAGQVLMMKRTGTVRAIPPTPEEPWVEFYGVFAEPGEVIGDAENACDFLAVAVLSAPTRAECEKRLRALGAHFETEFVIG
ncbi:hypothetical protein J7E97_17640 [Streptomyces sp. ISL-66]|uniref:hypothetical protein n=1 Tax=Streptomyces sp. ISL-66 TaxID=2819186 RepID=UPI001BE5889E|nr:hypothetical protein [Streptomyces sp. ISL-66]MBT2469648.1 hypothetical protein [Streptomyces sp. ISL-66]